MLTVEKWWINYISQAGPQQQRTTDDNICDNNILVKEVLWN